MSWLIVILGYLIGSIPTGYLAGRLLRGKDIRQMGDGNMGAQNAVRQLGAGVGVIVGLIDAAKGSLTILLAWAAHVPDISMYLAGAAAVIGHNWPIFLGFRGGRGEATTLGILLTIMPVPTAVLLVPGIVIAVVTHNVVLASVLGFVPLPLVAWWLHAPVPYIIFALALLVLVALTHLMRARRIVARQA